MLGAYLFVFKGAIDWRRDMFKENTSGGKQALLKYLSPVGAWALAFGCSVGWGSFVMPGTTFLPLAGPIGTTVLVVLSCFLSVSTTIFS